MTVIRSATAFTSVQLVGDEHDRRAGVAQFAHHRIQVVDLLRGEHRGRLVQDPSTPASRAELEDLDPLLDTHGQVLERRPGRRQR